MSDFEINDHLLTRECDQLAKDIFDEITAENPDADPDDLREEMSDRAHETADAHNWVIYNYKALMIAAHCDVTSGEQFLDDIGFEWKQDSTIYSVAVILAYGEMRARIDAALSDLIDNHDAEAA